MTKLKDGAGVALALAGRTGRSGAAESRRCGCLLCVERTLEELQLCSGGELSLVLASPENRCGTGWATESLRGLSDASPSGRGLTIAEICGLDMRSKAVFGFSSKSGASALGTSLLL